MAALQGTRSWEEQLALTVVLEPNLFRTTQLAALVNCSAFLIMCDYVTDHSGRKAPLLHNLSQWLQPPYAPHAKQRWYSVALQPMPRKVVSRLLPHNMLIGHA